ncbi:hypothetical protein [Paenibacillus sp. OK003]|uniref:hypothetical protein n=1 Tax=Paenibacillus sp. OK003 TaxID=1884380 RepID=UPI0008AD27F6|nr:hypothetical protein [Paenibacillus sp. OK003]SEL81296.1 hypothetical protein SAMN05518856_11928 [Paenibacillus sp. OK003]
MDIGIGTALTTTLLFILIAIIVLMLVLKFVFKLNSKGIINVGAVIALIIVLFDLIRGAVIGVMNPNSALIYTASFIVVTGLLVTNNKKAKN